MKFLIGLALGLAVAWALQRRDPWKSPLGLGAPLPNVDWSGW